MGGLFSNLTGSSIIDDIKGSIKELELDIDIDNLTEEDFIEKRIKAIAEIKIDIITILKRKLEECEKSLESITKHGAETDEEEKSKQKLLYDFWSLNRIKEIKQ